MAKTKKITMFLICLMLLCKDGPTAPPAPGLPAGANGPAEPR